MHPCLFTNGWEVWTGRKGCWLAETGKMREVARVMLPQARSRGYINRRLLMLSAALIAGTCPWARTRRERRL